jgi:hypothetical protein
MTSDLVAPNLRVSDDAPLDDLPKSGLETNNTLEMSGETKILFFD